MKKLEYVFSQEEMSTILSELKDAEQEVRITLSQLEDGDVKDSLETVLNHIQFSIYKLEE